MENKSILEKVDFLLSVAKRGKCTDEELKKIKNMVNEHSNNLIIGKVFGYSVSDYAIATLKWIGKDLDYKSIYDNLSDNRKDEIDRLINRKLYLEY